MYARATQLEIDALRASVHDAVALFEQDVLPRLREQPGYRGVLVLANPEGRGMLLTLWATETEAEAEGAFYEREIAKYITLFRAPPGREAYTVELCDGLALPSA
jgi:hypothetical protein